MDERRGGATTSFTQTSGADESARGPAAISRRACGRGARVLRMSLLAWKEKPASASPPASPRNQTNLKQLQEYVDARGGKRVIRKVLIANNGMAATKAILSMRKWAYYEIGSERAIEFVAMATPEDLNANAEFVRLADSFVEVPGGPNRNNYANVELICAMAKREGVDAVWPGWGHASENPRLPNSLAKLGIQFIGPTGPVMAVLGDKIGANILAQTANVPSIPWSGDGLTAELSEDGTIPREIFEQAMVHNVDEAIAVAERIGYPIMTKASEGGGGKGIRMSANETELRSNYEQVVNEVPGSPIFMMQLCKNARHIEVQIVGDEYGNAVALNGRDCSTQRRFQKIFEEGPPVIVEPSVFREMERAAQRLTQSIGYRGAGTVEYLYNADTQKFFFLELNPRLQVEHPVTEGLTRVNMPATQLQVAMGIALSRVPDIRRLYGRDGTDAYGDSPIDFMTEMYQPLRSHVIAARITAENPDEGFKPTSGRVERVRFQSSPDVWGYFSVGAQGGIHEFADSQFGHVFASGANREDARKALVLALKELEARGEIRNPVEYLVQLLETDEFKQNTIDTSWLDRLIREKSVKFELDRDTAVLAAAVYRAHDTIKRGKLACLEQLARGQSTFVSELNALNKFSVEITYMGLRFTFEVGRLAPDVLRLNLLDSASGSSASGAAAKAGSSMSTWSLDVKVREQPDQSLLCTMGENVYSVSGVEEPLGLRMIINGSTVMIPTIFDPSELRSDVTGKVVRFLKQDGDAVKKGEPYVELEAMKMIMQLSAGETGMLRHELAAGSIIKTGDLLARLDLDDPSKASPVSDFDGVLNIRKPEGRDVLALGMGAAGTGAGSYAVDIAAYKLRLILDGFQGSVGPALQQLVDSNAGSAEESIEDPVTACDIISRLVPLIEEFVRVEEHFDGRALNDSILAIKKSAGSDAAAIQMIAAHLTLPRRAELVLSLLRQLGTLPDRFPNDTLLSPELDAALTALTKLKSQNYGDVVVAAGQLLTALRTPDFNSRLADVRQFIMSKGNDSTALDEIAKSRALSVSVDLLCSLFLDMDAQVARAALEVYIRRVYRAHVIHALNIERTDSGIVATWRFSYADIVRGSPMRLGRLVACDSMATAQDKLPSIIDDFAAEWTKEKKEEEQEPIGTLIISFNGPVGALPQGSEEERGFISRWEGLLQARNLQLRNEAGVRTVNLLVNQAPKAPRMFSFNFCENYAEDALRRDMRTSFPYLLELSRLSENFELQRLPIYLRNAQLWLGTEKRDQEVALTRPRTQSLFLRGISHSDMSVPGVMEKVLLILMDQLDAGIVNPRVDPTATCNMFLNVLQPVQGAAYIEQTGGPTKKLPPAHTVRHLRADMEALMVKYAERLIRLRVENIELKIRVPFEADSTGNEVQQAVRLWASPTGGYAGAQSQRTFFKTDAFAEIQNPITGVTEQYVPYEEQQIAQGQQLNASASRPYYTKSGPEQLKRRAARRVGSTYAYDFMALFEIALVKQWSRARTRSTNPPVTPQFGSLMRTRELVLDKETQELSPVERAPGQNEIGMVAWLITLKTPEYPSGREIVVIANDVTFQAGSFGVAEDEFFFKASEYARVRSIPRIYLSSNSGARIGLVESLKPMFKVQFRDESNPTLGFEYLYLSEKDYNELPEGTVIAERRMCAGSGEKGEEVRYVLKDIIGTAHGIGVENLRGSGLIAGETSRAYDESFTLSYVTGRSVGIGAYLVRLGQRTIQQTNGPIILTGFQALNKLLGRDVYSSLDQLGGPQIMVPNGVTHELVENDQEGVIAILDWLAYVPATARGSPPILAGPPADPIGRDVEFVPPKGGGATYDVRDMLRGSVQPDGKVLRGFFDAGSFKEYLAGWGRSVVVGRARLGGIPYGVIAVETRTFDRVIPADPANAASRETLEPQAGQVWYPDSAFKTAQAIEDFSGENLPLMIFANWRGFSGGTRDMFGEVLKFGAMIVDALRKYDMPVSIYLPPNAELRGGAWVVVDPTINEKMMEMYADTQSRGGILEPPGICEVKFRAPDQLKAMHRLDTELLSLDARLENATEEKDRAEIKAAISKRENLLLPIYLQIAHEFADLHDRSGRMLAKGVIRDVVEWKRSREYFFWRTKRRLRELELRKHVAKVNAALDWLAATEVMRALVGGDAVWLDDRAFLKWFDENSANLDALLAPVRLDAVRASISELLGGLPDADRAEVLKRLES
ncbi:Acetyl-CoA carboxylase 2 [Porphyridium purpureum]|uniref:Acetyl-CoA carboxylase 2 n=1 Tax=Porphyridium purpureum TaxID=35688 RepID=A0A5J4YGS2_PORPP|nr:Acetyl-CoA carboxylase 2 [Porphyridium purpureum]|eukprot:POR8511..scf294_26